MVSISDSDRRTRGASEQLHRVIYLTIIGLVAILILSVWGFSGPGDDGLVLAVVTAFILIAVAIPLILFRIWRNNRAGRGDATRKVPFAAWREGEFETYSGPLKGSEAMVQVLLPIAAVTLGMAVFALVLYFDVGT